MPKVVLTHHTLKNVGRQPMALGGGEALKLEPITEAGSGGVQDKAHLAEIIEKVNELLDGQALNSESVQTGMKDTLLNHAGLYENLRSAARS